MEKAIRARDIPDAWGGFSLTLIVLFFWEGLLVILVRVSFFYTPIRFLFSLFVLYSCIAMRDLAHHVRPVMALLERGEIQKSRDALQMIVGRDTSVLNEEGIIRATIETIAEGLIDGFLSPVFYFSFFSLVGYSFHQPCLCGLAGALGYRIINTLDSMIGYKSETYFHFGRFAARLDDVVNFIPARLSLLFLFVGAWLLKMDAASGLESAIKYRLCSSSPNAGHPESFVAGVFHIQLGGLARYPFGEVKKPIIGDGSSRMTPETVQQTLRLVTVSGYLAVGFTSLFLGISPFVKDLFRF